MRAKRGGCRMPIGMCSEYREKDCDKFCYYNTVEVKTKADSVRSMTDEELAVVIKNPCDIGVHMPNEWCKKRDCGYQCSLDWLKQEASE